ncbi:MAG TPA: flagellar biosynthetic protein FliR, partial [Capsulimonadaceae bacterium]|nr:flagellar biosynthetic protein FliR [Capsulimonadaceae bacterium]
LAQVLNPTLGEMVTPISQFQYLYALLLFLLANGHYMLLSALSHSFSLLPVTSLALGGEPLLRFISDATLATLVSGVKIAAPAAGILMVIDLSFAFLSRAVPQMNVFYVGMPVKVLVGLAILGVVLPLTAYLIGQMVAGSQVDLLSVLRSMHG